MVTILTDAALRLATVGPLYLGLAAISIVFLKILHGLYTDRLQHIPGPLIARFTPVWYWYLSWKGIECRVIAALHKNYGPVVRIAPNEIDISDGAALHPIYVENGGFIKSSIYSNFDIDGFPTLFSGLDHTHRAVRAKAVAPLFAQQTIANSRAVIQKIIDTTIVELERRKSLAAGRPVDIYNLFRAMAMDVMTKYLVGECFNGVGSENLSAGAFIDYFAAVGRFYNLPGRIFGFVHNWAAKLHKNKASITTSNNIVQQFAAKVVDDSIAQGEQETYQGRLLSAKISREESIAQVTDIMFAGTDGEARILAVFCWYLVQAPDKYTFTCKEIIDNPGVESRSLPYLSGGVKEACRLALANPTRLPRIVSTNGLTVPGFPTIPAGTSVGIGAYELHFNPDVFPSPHDFLPERWLEPTPEMLRDSFYFGKGPRQCIARNFASTILWWAAEALLRSRVLDGAKPVKDELQVIEWFNIQEVGGKIELFWPQYDAEKN